MPGFFRLSDSFPLRVLFSNSSEYLQTESEFQELCEGKLLNMNTNFLITSTYSYICQHTIFN